MPKPTKMARDWQNGGMCKPFLAITPSQTAYLRASDYLVCGSALPPLPVMLSEAFYRHLPEQCRQQQSSAVDGTIPLSTFFTLLSLHCTAEAAAASSTLSSPSLHPLRLSVIVSSSMASIPGGDNNNPHSPKYSVCCCDIQSADTCPIVHFSSAESFQLKERERATAFPGSLLHWN